MGCTNIIIVRSSLLHFCQLSSLHLVTVTVLPLAWYMCYNLLYLSNSLLLIYKIFCSAVIRQLLLDSSFLCECARVYMWGNPVSLFELTTTFV